MDAEKRERTITYRSYFYQILRRSAQPVLRPNPIQIRKGDMVINTLTAATVEVVGAATRSCFSLFLILLCGSLTLTSLFSVDVQNCEEIKFISDACFHPVSGQDVTEICFFGGR